MVTVANRACAPSLYREPVAIARGVAKFWSRDDTELHEIELARSRGDAWLEASEVETLSSERPSCIRERIKTRS